MRKREREREKGQTNEIETKKKSTNAYIIHVYVIVYGISSLFFIITKWIALKALKSKLNRFLRVLFSE